MKLNDNILALIARNLAGLADSIETVQLDEWIGSSFSNKLYFEQIKNIWDTSNRQIDPKKINTTEALEKVIDRIRVTSPKKAFWYYWQKVAAIIILPMAIGTLVLIYLNSHKTISSNDLAYNEVYTAYGTYSSLRLPDSTLVWLNSGSTLKYPNKFNYKNRTVFLKGEAYFEVKNDESAPFVVQTSTLQVKATGTKFNVMEYGSNPISEVALVSGKVFVYNLCKNEFSQLISELNPNQIMTYNRQTKVKNIITEDTYRFIAWKDGKLIFRNEPLDRVLEKISIMYNVDLEIVGNELRNYRYHATFKDESLEEILKLLKLSSPINFMEVKRNPFPDGSFPKKKVIIFPANQTSKYKTTDY